MPDIEVSDLDQTAVLWPATGAVDRYGEPAVGDGEEIAVRWEWRQSEAPGPQGGTILLDAVAVVNQAITKGSLMWLGELADWPGTADGGDEDVMRVATYGEIPDLKGRSIRRVVGLQRHKGQP